MTVAAVGLGVAYFVAAFVVRSVVQRRRTGDWGFRLSRSRGAAARIASGLMVFGFGLVSAGMAADINHFLRLIPLLDHRPLRLGGIALMALALAATTKAQVDLRESWRIGVDTTERTDLVTDGVFSLVRNPIFSGMLLFGLGSALAVPNWFALIGLLLLAAGLEVQVRGVEEPYLLRVHGRSYRSYATRVGRFVPGIGRSPILDDRAVRRSRG